MAIKITKSSGNVFLDLGFPPHEAAVMLLRAQLAEALRSWMEQEALTQASAAKKLGISQPRVSEITRGKVELLSLDYLVGLCAKAGIPVKMRLAALAPPFPHSPVTAFLALVRHAFDVEIVDYHD